MTKIYSEQQLSSIVLGLEKGDIPVKYSYMTEEGAKARSKIEEIRTQKGQSFSDALLLESSIELYLQELGKPNELAIVDFGCGTGKTIKPTLEKLNKLDIIIHYHAIDISENIVSLCKKNIDHMKNCNFNSTIIDFEISNLVTTFYQIRKKYSNIPVLGLLLGNTVGNFNSMDRVLSNIIEALKLEDKLVIGIERADIQNRRWYEEMIKTYQSQEVINVFWAAMDELGFNKENGKYKSIFNEKTNTLEAFWEITKDFNIHINKHKLSFIRGERIRIGQSKKIDEMGFSKILLDLDLRIANIRTNEENSYIQALISSKRK